MIVFFHDKLLVQKHAWLKLTELYFIVYRCVANNPWQLLLVLEILSIGARANLNVFYDRYFALCFYFFRLASHGLLLLHGDNMSIISEL